ncbi:hypothetical protein BSKO_05062 [Bryopsis sp. KO-2023]|nr:hypothetical protein BSKO_05062 [Bryopsis sp. KO-2023]
MSSAACLWLCLALALHTTILAATPQGAPRAFLHSRSTLQDTVEKCTTAKECVLLNFDLLDAAEENDAEKVKLLLQRGANAGASNSFGTTALMYAASKGNFKSVMEILRAGPDVNSQNSDGQGALYFAAGAGYSKIVKTLIDYENNLGNKPVDATCECLALVNMPCEIDNCDDAAKERLKEALKVGGCCKQIRCVAV